jgi:hypothetical protein
MNLFSQISGIKGRKNGAFISQTESNCSIILRAGLPTLNSQPLYAASDFNPSDEIPNATAKIGDTGKTFLQQL